jgi:hypothetical protein
VRAEQSNRGPFTCRSSCARSLFRRFHSLRVCAWSRVAEPPNTTTCRVARPPFRYSDGSILGSRNRSPEGYVFDPPRRKARNAALRMGERRRENRSQTISTGGHFSEMPQKPGFLADHRNRAHSKPRNRPVFLRTSGFSISKPESVLVFFGRFIRSQQGCPKFAIRYQ